MGSRPPNLGAGRGQRPPAGRPPRHPGAGPGHLRARRAARSRPRALGARPAPGAAPAAAGHLGAGPDADERDLLEQRRTDLAREVGDDDRAVGRVLAAPARFLLVADPAEAARQFASIDPLPPRRELRVHVEPGGRDDRWWVEVVARTAPASWPAPPPPSPHRAATWSGPRWPPGPTAPRSSCSRVRGPATPDPDALTRAVDDAVSGLTEAGPLPDVSFRFDHRASPWHSVCEIGAPERAGLLAEVAAVLRAPGSRCARRRPAAPTAGPTTCSS
ncbi:MAG: hypothetical protein R2746_11290 [Acidimicrobiales bacterium]